MTMKSSKTAIFSKEAYQSAMKRLDLLMKKGESRLSTAEAKELRQLALAAEGYEKSVYVIPAPKTLEGLVELKMFERQLKQKELAKLLNIGEPKLSQIMSKKRKPDLAFLKAVHKHLGIDGNLLLEYA